MTARWLPALATLGLLALTASPAGAQEGEAVKPYFLVMVDTSGSMISSTGSGNNSCGQSKIRINDAKCALNDLVNAYGDVDFGLGRFQMSCQYLDYFPYYTPCSYSSTCSINGSGPTDAVLGEVIAPIGDNNQGSILSYVDFAESYNDSECLSCPDTDPQELLVSDATYTYQGNLYAIGPTPLAGTLNAARAYFEGNDPVHESPAATDPAIACRPYYVILLTDGDETCATQQDVLNAATALRSANLPGFGTKDIKTYVIAFGLTPPDPEINQIAAAGGTTALYAQDEEALSLAFSQIIQDSLLVEVCDNADNDCDGDIDEGFVKYCDLENGIADTTLCSNPGDPCDGEDDNCFASTSDEATNACGTCGPEPQEVCNGVDDNCNGFIDEGNVCDGCTVFPEICDGIDNDCDNAIDEGVSRECGTDVGECSPGVQVCIEQSSPQPSGEWGPCVGAVPPAQETCNNLDDDCNGLVDGFAQECYTFATGCQLGVGCDGICQTGQEVCTSGTFGTCSGEIGPANDICNNVDDDCDGMVDEGNPGGGNACGSTCGEGVTECQNGQVVCVGGNQSMPEECNGFDDDCDGDIDEDLDPMGPCDENGTLCTPGELQCVSGGWVCVGGVPPAPESCDCEDNDCDGDIDEDNPCPAGATCLSGPHCFCARPCAEGEFPCPLGSHCVDLTDPEGRFCVPDPCFGVQCEPDAQGNPTECVEGDCVPLCDTVSCNAPLVCRPGDGLCVPDDCTGFPDRCTEDELCVGGECVNDPCFGVECDPGEFCNGGDCVGSCAGVECPAGQSCDQGACADDPCDGVSCFSTEVCDPATGECVDDACNGVSCPDGQVCEPVSGDCIADPCLGVTCPGDQVCEGGNCFARPGGPDAGVSDPSFVTPGGGGGCTCRSGADPRAAWPLILALYLVLRRRRRPVA